MDRLQKLRLNIFADGADLDHIRFLSHNPLIKGFTTNPTLMRKAGVKSYTEFARSVLALAPSHLVALEVLADDFSGMVRQAKHMASWGGNVTVKIPVTNARREFTGPVIRELSEAGVRIMVTAVLTLDQMREVTECLAPEAPAMVSIFAGRIADTGRDPMPLMAEAVNILRRRPNAQFIWASPRELLNIFQAETCGCHFITLTSDILAKLSLVGKDLGEYSYDTVKMLHRDATEAGYSIDENPLDIKVA